MTSNPYAAQHSDHAGLGAKIIVETWLVSPAWFLLLVSLLAIAVNKVRIPRYLLIPLAILPMWFSGFLSGEIISKPQTYVFNAIMLVLSAIMAVGDATTVFRTRWENRNLVVAEPFRCLPLQSDIRNWSN